MIKQLSDIPALVPKLLLQLVEVGRISDAATLLGVSQPAASKAIQRAEQVLGFELIRRDSRPLRLTEEGRLIVEYARHQQCQEEVLIRKLRLIQKEGAGVVKIASFGASASTHILPNFIHKLSQKLPEVSVEVSEYNDEGALSALRDGRVDFAIMVDNSYLDLDVVPIFTDRLMALVHDDDSLAKLPALSAKDITNRDFILTKGGSESLIKEWFSASNFQPNVKHTAVQLTSILALIRTGLGVSIVAELAIPESHPNVTIVPLTPEYLRRICLAKRNGSFSSNAAKCTWDYFQRNIT